MTVHSFISECEEEDVPEIYTWKKEEDTCREKRENEHVEHRELEMID